MYSGHHFIRYRTIVDAIRPLAGVKPATKRARLLGHYPADAGGHRRRRSNGFGLRMVLELTAVASRNRVFNDKQRSMFGFHV